MNQKLMHLQNLYNFSLVRFQPGSIILLDKHTRKAYEFYQVDNLQNIHPQLSHPTLLRPILYKNGALYAKACQNLASILEVRRRDYIQIRYSSEQIINTFEPIFQCLEYLHQKDITYGNLSSEHISFFQNGEILLKDWFFKKCQQQPGNKSNKIKDMKDIGLLMAEAATLIPHSQITKLATSQIAQILLQHYSIPFCSSIIILLQGYQKYYPLVLGLANNQLIDCQLPQIKQIIQQVSILKTTHNKDKNIKNQCLNIKDKLLKQVENQKRIITPKRQYQQNKCQSIININNSIQSSPTRKFIITTPSKKIIRLQDCQNKKIFNQQVKKRQIQKITKIIQRSNAFVNQLMARKNNDKKFFNTTKVTTSLFDTQENNKKREGVKESPKINSPVKRMRSISKKK